MNTLFLKMYIKYQDLINREEGQDMVEYALVVALIALGATATMQAFASEINTVFTNLTSQLNTNIS